jgi:hypothetical protein
MKERKKPEWGCIGCGLLVTFWVVVGILALIQHFQEKSVEDLFSPMTEHYQAFCGICFSRVSEFPTLYGSEFDSYLPYSPYLHGKVLVVEALTGDVLGSSMTKLSSEIAATNPGEETTLVCAGEVDKFVYSTYTDNEPGYRLTRKFCVFDMSTEDVVFAAEIYGTPPPVTKQLSGPADGTDPAYSPLIQILEELPKE